MYSREKGFMGIINKYNIKYYKYIKLKSSISLNYTFKFAVADKNHMNWLKMKWKLVAEI